MTDDEGGDGDGDSDEDEVEAEPRWRSSHTSRIRTTSCQAVSTEAGSKAWFRRGCSRSNQNEVTGH